MLGGGGWRVNLHPAVARALSEYRRKNADFRPPINTMLEDLRSDPKAIGKKKAGRLSWARAYTLRYRGDLWRAVYEVLETERVVKIWSFAQHDDAYNDAMRRR